MAKKAIQFETAPVTPEDVKSLSERFGRDFFTPYQWRWIDDPAPMKLAPKSRRIGFTYATSYRCVRKCMKRKNFTQWVSSKDLLLAREFVTDYVAKWCKLANIVASGLEGEKLELIDPKKDMTAYIVRFPNGSRIVSLSSNPNAFAGKGGDVLLDEVDLHDDSGVLIDMATPCTMWGGQLEIISAYDADGSTETPFAKLVEEVEEHGNPMNWSFHKVDIDDAIAQGIVAKINAARRDANPEYVDLTDDQFRAECRAKCRTEAAWLSQYKCMPVNAIGSKAVKPNDLLASKQEYPAIFHKVEGDAKPGEDVDPSVAYLIAALTRDAFDFRGRPVLGYDIARTGHLSSVWIDDEFETGKYQLACLILLHNCKFASQRELISHILDMFPNAVGAGDSTGLGMDTCETLEHQYLGYDGKPGRFLGVNFGAAKKELGTLLTAVFENGLQIIPAKPASISADIACIEFGLTTGKKLIYIEKENRLMPDSHADMAWSCALAKKAGRDLGGVAAVFGEPAGESGRGQWRRGVTTFADSAPDFDEDYQPTGSGWGF
ncbi:MAG: hypothetical protein RRC34_02840 [Lentisphaeria bacterium]|nr:hypothetical protein [Lentisphaeria bacterium]